MFFNLLFVAFSMLGAFIPAIIVAVLGGMILQIIGIPYTFGYWIAGIIGYIGSALWLISFFIASEPTKRQRCGGFVAGFILGRLSK